MNEKGGFIEIFVGMLLALLLIGFILGNLYNTTYPLTQSSTWSGDGTMPGILFAGIGLILIAVVFFWSFKSNVVGGQNF